MVEPKPRRVLMIGGPFDGKWKDAPAGKSRILDVPRLPVFDMKVFKPEDPESLDVPVPQYDRYYLEQVALYGEGIWVGLHMETMDKMDMDRSGAGWRDAHTTMILRAILQRDILTAMGL